MTVPTMQATTDDWQRDYARKLIFTDSLVVIFAVAASQALWLAFAGSPLLIWGRTSFWSSLVVAIVIILIWVTLLGFYATRDRRYLGVGAAEYRSVVDVSIRLFAVVVFLGFVFQLDMSRGVVITAFIMGLAGLLIGRWGWRQWLVRRRKEGTMSARVIIAGEVSTTMHLLQEFRRMPAAGYQVIGVCLPNGESEGVFQTTGVPVLGGFNNIPELMNTYGADTLAIAGSGRLPASRVREISWDLEPGRQHLIVAPTITDVGGPRISMRPVAGMPLVHVETPKFERGQQAMKRWVDILGGAVLVLLLSPVLAVIALLVRSDGGPAFFRQQRIGLNGKPFSMLKFRSMVVNAEAALADLTALDREEGNTVLFKMKDDPRITKVGKFIRRYSLDELPQLFNVLAGSMSLIGPRPPLQSEVDNYEDHVHRRFLMKPGITGLWQVNGRSNLSWEESVRLDLYYVENWSLTGDIVILWKTVKAVVQRDGAY